MELLSVSDKIDLKEVNIMLNKHWNAIVHLMDDEKREQVHRELAPCSNEEFLDRYLELEEEFEMVLKEFGELK